MARLPGKREANLVDKVPQSWVQVVRSASRCIFCGSAVCCVSAGHRRIASMEMLTFLPWSKCD
eukprot:1240514-Rhodomonas_salina.1